jgi:hypothetical protein
MPESDGSSTVTLEELEAVGTAPVKPKLDEIKLDGDGIPDEFKGKSVAELVQFAKGAGDSLKLSEAERKRLAELPPPQQQQQIVVQQPKEEPKELTDEELAELHSRDALAAIRYMNARALRTIEQNFDKRLGGLVGGAAATAESAARTKYPEEFALFGDQIKAMTAALPSKEPLSQPQAWEDMVSYIRGQPANFDKLVAHRAEKSRAKLEEDARTRQIAEAGPAMRSEIRAPAPGSQAGKLDAIQLECARNLNMTPEEYAKWQKM